MVEQPSGTVTLVFTDIEGSTRLLHELGEDAYLGALAKQRRIVREAFADQSGYEVDYEGDAFFYAFATAPQALAAVGDAMQRLEGGPVRIRVGVHTGSPGLDPPKYVGLDVHLAARVMSVAHGGQVLLSRATKELIEADVVDLGEHRLKDFADPVWLFQVGRHTFPPLRSLNNTNLPTPASSFLGREAELEQAELLLESERLVTISGPGGAGKTRFALELAARQLARFPNGVFWVPLAALRDPALVTETIAYTLGAKGELAEHIGDRRTLLLVDNFEQVIEAAPQLAALMSSCANLGLLVTSRELLRVEGEANFPLPPLVATEAVELFCARARCEPDPAVEDLCGRLDGLPLAIELASARMTVFTPEQLLHRLSQRLELLKGSANADPRQQTLRATIQWSYDLLSEHEASLFRRLSVFAGRCTLDAAEETLAADPDTLQSLVEKSLVRRTGDRFWMLETIREFGLEQLEARGETTAARTAYSAWMLRLAQSANEELYGPSQQAWFERLHQEYDNIAEVITLALDAEDAELAISVLVALRLYWPLRPGEALAWFDRALKLVDEVPPLLAARALHAAGGVAWFVGQPELTRQHSLEGLAIFERLGDESGIALSCGNVGFAYLEAGKLAEAAEFLERALEIHERLGTESERAIDLQGLGAVAERGGELARASERYEQSIALARRAGNSRLLSANLQLLGWVRFREGEVETALSLTRESLELAWPARLLEDVALCFGHLAIVLGKQGKIRSAALLWGAGRRLDTELGQTRWRYWQSWFEGELVPAVLDDEDGISLGAALPTTEAVEFALAPPTSN
jgi:predicted ATPase